MFNSFQDMCPEMCVLETDWPFEYWELAPFLHIFPFDALCIIYAVDAQAACCIQAWLPRFVLDSKFPTGKQPFQ